ncbi:hypothetical protein FPV67DRAFT_1471108 [Lyophyllum atratum]|nr:hypothetical protein FPV67DRAFT_1471108 [Lyophyllum atratum]
MRHSEDPELDVMEVEAHERAVTLIDDEIEALMRTVRQLQFRKSQYQDKIKHVKGLTTLARRLPIELLACIIEECVRDGWTRTPLSASHVCSEWRKAAEIPTVWSHVYVNCDGRDPCGRTRFWLEKAHSSPLRITVDVTNDPSRISGVMDILLARVTQWKSFTVNSTRLFHANSVLTLCNRPTPELRTLSVSVAEEFDENIDTPVGDVGDLNLTDHLFHAAHFRTFRIIRNILPSPGTVPSLITILSITLSSCYASAKSSIDKALRLLEGLPALQDLSILLPYRQTREFERASDENHLVHLPDLQTLVLVGSPEMFRLLPHLSTPSLSRLYLRSSLDPLGYPEEETGTNITKFIQQDPPLELLELHDIDLSPCNFVACFARLPRLQELHLHESDISDSVIERFMAPTGFCPLLNRLDLRWCGQVTGRALVELVRARHLSTGIENYHDTLRTAPISTVTVINCSFVKEEEILELSRTIVCRIIMQPGDYCRPFGCCQNERYRKRLKQHAMLQGKGTLWKPRSGTLIT